jgi:hypothetical protein
MAYISNDGQYDITSKLSNNKFWTGMNMFEIPYNQRAYSWEKTNIKQYLRDIDDYSNGKIKFITFGTYYFLCESNNSSDKIFTIWDGQQRIITSYLLLASIYKRIHEINKMEISEDDKYICNDNIKKIENYLFKQYNLEPKERDEIKRTNLKIPKLYTVHPHDNIIFRNILNLKIKSLKTCYKKTDEGKFECCNCDKSKKYILEENIENHLLNKCDGKKYLDIIDYYKSNISYNYHTNNMINGNYIMYNFVKKTYGDNLHKLINFLDTYENKIPHEEYICKNIDCATVIFDLLNNRGKSLEQTDIVRNYLIRIFDDDKKEIYFEKFNNLLNIHVDIPKLTKKDDNILKLLIHVTNKEFEIKINCITGLKEIFEKNNTVEKNFVELEKNSEMIKQIYKSIMTSKYGSIFFSDFIWDIFQHIVVPYYYVLHKSNNFNKLFDELLEIIACYQIKSSIKMRNFTSAKKESIFFANKLINNEIKHDQIILEVKKLINTSFLKKGYDDYKNMLKKINYTTNNNAIKILKYYEIKNKPDSTKLMDDTIELEHIMAKSTKDVNINKIGNLTLLEKCNSDSGQYGNASLKDKNYTIKRKEYLKSNIKITRDIAEKYTTWDESTINERSIKILNFVCNKIDNILDTTDKSKLKKEKKVEIESSEDEKIVKKKTKDKKIIEVESEDEKLLKKKTKDKKIIEVESEDEKLLKKKTKDKKIIEVGSEDEKLLKKKTKDKKIIEVGSEDESILKKMLEIELSEDDNIKYKKRKDKKTSKNKKIIINLSN